MARVLTDPCAGNLTRAARDVLLTLHTYRGPGGVAWPSHATLAQRAKCSTRTVLRALAQGRNLGLVSWSFRRVRQGWRWLQSSNLYRFLASVDRAAVREPLSSFSSLPSGATVSVGRKHAAELRQMIQKAAETPDLLKARRAVFEAAQLGAAAGRTGRWCGSR